MLKTPPMIGAGVETVPVELEPEAASCCNAATRSAAVAGAGGAGLLMLSSVSWEEVDRASDEDQPSGVLTIE